MAHNDRPDRGWGLPGPEPAPTVMSDTPPSPEAPTRRRVARVLAVAAVLGALLVAAAGAGVAAWRNYDAGAAWQGRAADEAERAAAAEAALQAEHERADALERRVAELESDVTELEDRLVALAGEKAGAEDEALVAQETAERLQETTRQLQETADRLAELSRFATETGASLQRCINASLDLTNDIVAAVNDGTLDAESTNRRISEVNGICGDAQQEYAELRRRVDALAP